LANSRQTPRDTYGGDTKRPNDRPGYRHHSERGAPARGKQFFSKATAHVGHRTENNSCVIIAEEAIKRNLQPVRPFLLHFLRQRGSARLGGMFGRWRAPGERNSSRSAANTMTMTAESPIEGLSESKGESTVGAANR
jgi:hypothetical protein